MPSPLDNLNRSRSWWKSPWIAALVAVVCYLSTLANEFTYDDVQIVHDNPRIRSLTNFHGIWLTDWWATPAAGDEPMADPQRDRLYRPLTLFSFALNYAAGGLDPLGYHLVNVVLHAAVCVLVWHFSRRIVPDDAIATISALLFAVHPVHAEAVAGIVGRAEILSAGLLLLGFLALLPRDGSLTRGRTAWAALAFLGALLAKETAICYPLLAAALLVHFRIPWRRILVASPVLLAPLVVYFPLRLVALDAQLIRDRLTSVLYNPLYESAVWSRIHGPFTILGHYARLLFVPSTLSCDYGLAIVDPERGPVFLTFVGLLTLVVLLALAARWVLRVRNVDVEPQRNTIALLAALFLLSYLLISNTFLLIGVSLAERLLYWPSVLVALALAIAAVWLWRNKCGPGGPIEGLAKILPLLGVALLVGLGSRSCVRGMDWYNDPTLFRADATTYPQGAHLNASLARMMVTAAERMTPGPQRDELLAAADKHATNALNVNSRYPIALEQRAIILELQGKPDAAIPLFELALQLNPSDRQALTHLNRLRGGEATSKQSRLDELLAAIAREPNDTRARVEAGELLIGLGRNVEALQQYEAAIRVAPNDLAALRGYGQALLVLHDDDKARVVLLRVVERDPDDWQTHSNLVSLLEHTDPAAALVHAQRAAALQPGNLAVQVNLAAAYAINRRHDDAIQLYRQILTWLPANDARRAAIEDRIREVENQR